MATKRKAGSRSAKKSSARGGAKKARRGSAKKGGSRGSAKRSRASSRKSGTRAKRAPNPAFMKPMQPDAQLAQVVGSTPAPRTEITKKLWQYIKRKGLQDQKQRRMINADENLRPIFGGRSQVSMFDMTKLVNKHMREA